MRLVRVASETIRPPHTEAMRSSLVTTRLRFSTRQISRSSTCGSTATASLPRRSSRRSVSSVWSAKTNCTCDIPRSRASIVRAKTTLSWQAGLWMLFRFECVVCARGAYQNFAHTTRVKVETSPEKINAVCRAASSLPRGRPVHMRVRASALPPNCLHRRCGKKTRKDNPMAITATFVPGTGILSVLGDSLDDVITISRNAAGLLLINGGAIPVIGGTPTVANTALIQVFGLAGNDNIKLDESNGALPAAQLFGGNGNDTLTGGSGNDLLFGQA